ncbi:hypothetical protein B0I35DRAFT_360720 [Stachybotrys elegans]|uniref:ML-like domain-containing protein n=1 Tax=Stachybotrys elegans TaxID=80388 RepID=A0A8K0SFH0_9HYPO|nr:hypothetical protein B0I35DRAFT_360720 [Stachybotrys elegans]
MLYLLLSCLAGISWAQIINGTGLDGVTRQLHVSRYPTLYTRDFDDCMGGNSLFNASKFDAAYYTDNLTVLFHLDGTTNVRDESVIFHLAIEAYGETRYNTTYEPCSGNITTMCPMNADDPIEAFGVIPIQRNEVVLIPSISLNLPDFDGLARLRIFSNSTENQIACFQAAMVNGQTLSQPHIVGSIVGGFTFLAVLASFATAIYGIKIVSMRMHYAHSFSVLVIFETLQSIFFSGALSVDWPSVLPAWWSNFAWSAGMIAEHSLIRSISSFTGTNANISYVGGGGSVPANTDGGVRGQIFGRSLALADTLYTTHLNSFPRRSEYNASDPYDYNWRGSPRKDGMPMPGTWPGFGGTLSRVNVPIASAFTLGLVWLLVILGAVVLFIVVSNLVLSLLVKTKLLKTDGFDYFRSHLPGYVAVGVLRTLFIAFFAIMTLAMFQFSLGQPAGPLAVSVVVWAIFLLGLGGVVIYSWHIRSREGKLELEKDTLRFETRKLFKVIPFIRTIRASKLETGQNEKPRRVFGSIPIRYVKFTPKEENHKTVHQDEAYIKRFGWLSARYRGTRWWFYSFYLVYQFVRACFIGGGAQNPMAQVFGLFAWEIIILAIIWKMRPFEGARNTAVAVNMLSISKIITTGLSIGFLPEFGISRVAATILGFIIIVVQAFLAAVILVLVALGIISSWMSLSRNREQFLKPLDPVRIAYYEHIHVQATGQPLPEPKPQDDQENGTFNVKNVRRAPKIEDEDPDIPDGQDIPDIPETADITSPASPEPDTMRRSRANSASSRYSVSSLPRGARVHRASWSSRDFAQWDAEMTRTEQNRASRSRSNSLRMQALNQRPGTLSPTSAPLKRPMTPTREHSMEIPRLTVNTDVNEMERRISEERNAEVSAGGLAESPAAEGGEKRPASRRTVSPMTPTDPETNPEKDRKVE